MHNRGPTKTSEPLNVRTTDPVDRQSSCHRSNRRRRCPFLRIATGRRQQKIRKTHIAVFVCFCCNGRNSKEFFVAHRKSRHRRPVVLSSPLTPRSRLPFDHVRRPNPEIPRVKCFASICRPVLPKVNEAHIHLWAKL